MEYELLSFTTLDWGVQVVKPYSWQDAYFNRALLALNRMLFVIGQGAMKAYHIEGKVREKGPDSALRPTSAVMHCPVRSSDTTPYSSPEDESSGVDPRSAPSLFTSLSWDLESNSNNQVWDTRMPTSILSVFLETGFHLIEGGHSSERHERQDTRRSRGANA